MTKRIGIVGHEAAKFTPVTEREARLVICDIIGDDPAAIVVSGACHLGGIDIWAEDQAKAYGCDTKIFPPKTRNWGDGYKPRNIQIAEHSDELHCIVVAEYPATYTGMRFNYCYHCKTDAHIKSGGCWTAKYFEKLRGVPARWHIIGRAADGRFNDPAHAADCAKQIRYDAACTCAGSPSHGGGKADQ